MNNVTLNVQQNFTIAMLASLLAARLTLFQVKPFLDRKIIIHNNKGAAPCLTEVVRAYWSIHKCLIKKCLSMQAMLKKYVWQSLMNEVSWLNLTLKRQRNVPLKGMFT